MKSVGFCLGVSSVSVVEIEKNNTDILINKTESKLHDGNVQEVLKELYKKYCTDDIQRIGVTGRKFRSFVNLDSISETEAVEIAYQHVKNTYNNPNVIVSAGGETFMVYELDQKGKISNVFTGSKCASGTGEFFLQQLKRMNIDIETAMKIADSDAPLKVAGRCSVFCKSDCTHALNKGAEKGKIVAGLCQMMGNKILELLKKTKNDNVLLIGGTSKNNVMVDYIKREKSGVNVASEADYFEALGVAIWALDNKTDKIAVDKLYKEGSSSFSFLPALEDHRDKVTFKQIKKDKAVEGDNCIVGLDVGSTTTKAVLVRTKDNTILASVYLRTNGDPVNASKECYRSLQEQVSVPISVTGVGVTGSGRQIAGLHALTEGVVNEIIAHATAAVHFDSEVDTIFEIGGQDAKYTFITNKVPSDYAMNEACSAGTGSFLEESAKESMGIDTIDIADLALKSTNPPNFNDQCAAFISSDIKTAIQEGINREDILAGLVYSICQNYSNRVKGNRPVGKKIFMQGGVCYNSAVPIAMAAFTGKEIIVPPEPGLMGAFGVALEINNKINLGLMKEKTFDLQELSQRDVSYGKSFICAGGKEKCDRACKISMIEISDKKYPFGGACNKYVNEVRNLSFDSEKLDLVILREKLVYEKYAPKENNNIAAKKIGITKSLLVNTLFPLYYNFFTKLGLRVETSDQIDQDGIDKKGAEFCYPIEVAHGHISNLLKKDLDYIFLPQVQGMYVENSKDSSLVCPFVQGEPYYLKTAFSELSKMKVLSPVLNFSKGYHSLTKEFVKIGQELGFNRKESIKAYKVAFEMQRALINEFQEIGRSVLDELEKNPEKLGIVLFGRPYNAFTQDVNMGIPHKFSSRGYTIIPLDFLPIKDQFIQNNMYWSMGKLILKSAGYIEKHPQLFGAYITNFSCGPDSFLLGYFRDIMKQKPSLTLELDAHTADAGVDTRVEAFIDVIGSYIELKKQNTNKTDKIDNYVMSSVKVENGEYVVTSSNGNKYSIRDKNVHVLVPSMGDIASRGLAATFKSEGINASAVIPPGSEELKMGRANSTCKECLPLVLTVGSLLNYIENRKNKDEILIYFMPNGSGPCRFGQYNIMMRNLVQKNKIRDVALLSLDDNDGYKGFGNKFLIRTWYSFVISDVLDEIYSSVLVLSKDKDFGIKVFNGVVEKILYAIEKYSLSKLKYVLKESAKELSMIPLKDDLHSATKVALVGEIYVRRDGFSRQFLVEKLAENNIIVKISPVSEWLHYIDYLIKNKLIMDTTNKDVIKTFFSSTIKSFEEKEIKKIFAKSNLYEYNLVNIDKIINNAKHAISPRLSGEAILTVGSALTEIIDEVSGIISIGPFGCMPNRMSEAIISEVLSKDKLAIAKHKELVKKVMDEFPSLPFLAIESDGNAYPQVIQAKIESFSIQVHRINTCINTIKENENFKF